MPKGNYSEWTKQELIREIEKLKKRKKYGIVWEEKSEKVAELCKEKLPVLVEDKSKEIRTDEDKPINILIEGDNYHSLSVLNYTHKGKIDVIYIDPPFNVGKKKWKYNNDYIDKEDAYRHSKWLSMMDKRLKLAKKLLKQDGVLICAIDENELWHLGCLLEDIFAGWEIHLVTIVHNPRGVQGKNFSYTNEFAFFVFRKDLKVIGPRELEENEIYWSNFRNWGGESLRTDAENCFYPIIVKDNKIIGFGDVPDDNFHPKNRIERVGNLCFVWPIDKNGIERKWRYARQSVESVKHLLRVREVKKRNGQIEIDLGKPYGTIKTVWQSFKYDASEYGTKLLHQILPNSNFDYPKSLYTVYDCIYPIVAERKNALILDFFAGSGTTGHAVLEMNKKDGGNRQFILATNNEIGYEKEKEIRKKHEILDDDAFEEWKRQNNKKWRSIEQEFGICSSITYPRLKRVIEGYKYKGENKHILLELELTPSKIKKIGKVKEIIDEVIKEDQYQQKQYDKIKIDIKNKTILIYGIEYIDSFKKGLGGNLKYFKTDFVDAEPTDENKKKLVDKSTEMLCLKEDCFDLAKETEYFRIFRNSRGKYLGIIYDDEGIESFKKEVKNLKEKFVVYVFSLDESAREEEFEDVTEMVELRPIPAAILNVYRRLFK
jgi:adenine-specific DNA-methyltransferase